MRNPIQTFLADERAAISIETAIVLPFLVLVYLQAFTYFDAYRKQGQLEKAAYAIGDLLSRQTTAITTADLEGLQDVFGYITSTTGENWLRVTEMQSQTDESLSITWSYATDGNPILFNSYLPRIEDKLPSLESGERMVLIESYTRYRPVFNVGLPNRIVETFTPTRTRFAGQLPCPDCPCPEC